MDMFQCHGLRIYTRLANMTVTKENCGMMVAVMPHGKQNLRTVLLLMICMSYYTLPCVNIVLESLQVDVTVAYRPFQQFNILNSCTGPVSTEQVHDEVKREM